jgi:hypothetical protein
MTDEKQSYILKEMNRDLKDILDRRQDPEYLEKMRIIQTRTENKTKEDLYL